MPGLAQATQPRDVVGGRAYGACMTLTIGMVTVDTRDAERLGGWWAEQLGTEVAQNHEGWFVVVPAGPVLMAFQKVEDPTPGKNRWHLDLTAEDLDAEVDRLVAAGATLVGRRGDAGFSWATLTDPDGNEFDIASAHEAAASY